MFIKRNKQVKSFEDYKNVYLGDVHISESYVYPNMKDAVELFLKHIRNRSKIVGFGDYDADGTCGLSGLKLLGKELMTNITVIAPDRFTDGYGLNVKRVEQFINEGVNLLILIDNGITAIEPVAMAREAGIDVLILDHHEAKDILPNANVIVDPHVTGADSTGFDDLCGAGLTLQFAIDVLSEVKSIRKERKEIFIKELYAIAAIGTVGDMVTLREQNRDIVIKGLEYLNDGIVPAGLKALLNKLAEHTLINSEFISFTIAPSINAMGRLKSFGAQTVVDTMTAPSAFAPIVNKCVAEIVATNEERKALESEELERAISTLDVTDEDRVVIYVSPLGRSGLMGLVSGKLAEHFRRPAICLCGNGILKGSGRTYGDANIFEALTKVSKTLDTFGGHKEACGLSLKEENLSEFKALLNEVLPAPTLSKDVFYDLDLDPEDVKDMVETLKAYEPFGIGFPCPVFKVSGKVANTFRMGSAKQHVKVVIPNMDLCAFKYSGPVPTIGQTVSAVGKISENLYKGNLTYQMITNDNFVIE